MIIGFIISYHPKTDQLYWHTSTPWATGEHMGRAKSFSPKKKRKFKSHYTKFIKLSYISHSILPQLWTGQEKVRSPEDKVWGFVNMNMSWTCVYHCFSEYTFNALISIQSTRIQYKYNMNMMLIPVLPLNVMKVWWRLPRDWDYPPCWWSSRYTGSLLPRAWQCQSFSFSTSWSLAFQSHDPFMIVISIIT